MMLSPIQQVSPLHANCFAAQEISLNVEENSQDFVLEKKQIILSDYKEAFNPSIVRWKDQLLMSFRILVDPKNPWISPSAMGLVWLDDSFCPISPVQILSLKEISLDDCRLAAIQDQLFIIFNRWVPEAWSSGQKMYVAKLLHHDDQFSIILDSFIPL